MKHNFMQESPWIKGGTQLAVQYPRLRGTDSQSLYIQVMQLEIMQDGCVVTHCNPLLRGGS